MIYINPQHEINASSGNSDVMIVASPGGFPIELESLIMIVDLRSLSRDFSSNDYTRTVALKFREQGQQKWGIIAEISCVNKGSIYRENLMKYLTPNSEWRIAPGSEMKMAIVGTPLTGTDTIQVLGCGYQPDI